ncbi:MAG: hypothetical protein RMK97_03085 [Sutterellaceae bacterium]|nr:hypothetical protein [Burkholderiaceae bacterium]MDW8429478.1 hypothetical protein [Sutterellaceae bacterium]
MRGCEFLLAILLLIGVMRAHAVGPDPRADWRSADTVHFRVHYRAEQRALAERVSAFAEHIYPRVTRQLQWEPRGRTEIVLISELDLTNGFSTPLPFNTLGIYLAPPDDGELLDNSDWLQLLLLHEFTHIVHLDKVRGAPRVLQWIFGRVPWFFPNVWQPLWAIEGLATYNESDPATGRGRLHGPLFEAWLRAERARGFKTLAELNADGRALPLSKQYLYGAYFYEYLGRTYGEEAIFRFVDRYSGNVVPRVHTNPVAATGKTMDVLWQEFLADLAARVDARSAPLRGTPETVGQPLGTPIFSAPALAPGPDGSVYAVLDDGLLQPQLVRLHADGRQQALAPLQRGARIDARGGTVLVAQPEICDNRNLFYDLYAVRPDGGVRRLTYCARLRRAVWAGDWIVALRNDAGTVAAVLLDAEGRALRTLYSPAPETDVIDLAASGDGTRVALVAKSAGRWSVLELDLRDPGLPPALRFVLDTPLLAPRYDADGALTFIAARDGVYDVWRHRSGASRIERLTRTHTAVLSYAFDGEALTLAVLVADGAQLHRLSSVRALAEDVLPQTEAPAEATQAVASAAAILGAERPYSALRSLYPRSWLPMGFSDRGLSAIGASTFGRDTLGWHRYLATVMWEPSQREPLGSVEYALYDRHFVAATRTLRALAWHGARGQEEITVYERSATAQWISTLPWLQLQRRVQLGLGAGLDRTEEVDVAGPTARRFDARVAAAYVVYDTRGANWLSEGVNRGTRAQLLHETHRPFSGSFDGSLWRLDLQGFLPMGRTVLAAQWVEARANGTTAPYQLGGAVTLLPLAVPKLNDRELPLRGYRGSEPTLRGQNARVASVEWRTPLADIDRHAMVPPVGLNRLSTAVFFDIGAAWDRGSARNYRRGVGFELLGEVKLLYLLKLQLRAGLARGLDEPRGTRAYLSFGRAF